MLINPADLATSDKSPKSFMFSHSWWHGPTFLSDNSDLTPVVIEKYSSEKCNDEIKKSQISHNIFKVQKQHWDIAALYSSYRHLLQMTAWFIRSCHNRTTKGFKTPSKLNLVLQPEELDRIR